MVLFRLWDWHAYGTGAGTNPSEVDYNLGCVIPAGPVDLHVTVSYFDLPPQFTTFGDVFQSTIGVSKTFAIGDHSLTPYFNFKPTIPLGYNSGLYSEVGVNDVWTINDRLSLTLGARVLNDTGAYENTPGWNLRLDAVAMYWLLPKTLYTKVGLRDFQPLSKFDNPLDPRPAEFVGYGGLGVNF